MPAPRQQHNATSCRHGVGCKRFGCYFQHPPERRGDCRYGATCHRADCRFLHPPERAAAAEGSLVPRPAVTDEIRITTWETSSDGTTRTRTTAVTPGRSNGIQHLSGLLCADARLPASPHLQPPLARPHRTVKFVAHAKPAPDAAPPKPRGRRPVCQVCQEETRPADGTFCTAEPSAHFVCGACLMGHVTSELEKLVDADRLRAHRKTGGRIRCVCFGGGQSACTGSYTDKSLALHVKDELFERYRAKQDEVVEQRHWEAAQAMIAAKARAAEHEVLAEGLRRQLPDARQCGSCGFGPVEHTHCSDLLAHHGQGGISNACPRCGWLTKDREAWPKWDGRMHTQ